MTQAPDGRSSFHPIRDLFEEAWRLPEGEREAFVRRAAGSDAMLAHELVELLGMAMCQGTGPTLVAARAWFVQHTQIAKATPIVGGERVQSTATDDLLQKLATAPKLDRNRYQLEGEVGRGGMGAILRIHDTQLNRRLAMKVMLEHATPRDHEQAKLVHQVLGRFLEEAQVTSQLDHPGVVPVHELGLDQNGKVYFTMRLVKGRTAGDIFELVHTQREQWTTTRALEVVLKVCDTMSYAHDKGVLHRDLKPSNVMVGRFGEVYVMDWGLAKVTGHADRHDLRIRQTESTGPPSQFHTARQRDAEGEHSSSVVSMDGQKLGTPSYMAPEQARSEALDQRADVYSIGAMLYELLTGQPPYVVPGLWQPAYRVLEKVIEGPPRRIEQITPGLAAELVAIVDKAMARNRELRFASTTELATDLRAFLDQRAVKAHRTGALVELKLWVRRNRPLAGALAAAVLILVLGIVGTTAYANEATKLAQDKTDLAAAEAAAKNLFEGKVREFDQLKGVVLYDRVIGQEKELYPAWPTKIAAMEAWLKEDADTLLAMQPELARTVRDLESRAPPATPEEQAIARRTHPRFGQFDLLTKRVAALSYAQTLREGQALVVPTLTVAQQALNATALNSLAWPRVAPKSDERTVYGEEAFGLACAQAAVAKAHGTNNEYWLLDTLAWALLANGQDAEAKLQSAAALSKAPVNEQTAYLGHQRDLAASIQQAGATSATAQQELAELTAVMSERRAFRFELESQRFLHNTLVELLTKMTSLAANEQPAVSQRLVWAKQIQDLSLHHPNARHTWEEVRSAIAAADDVVASKLYAGQPIELREQDITGLVPIGMNPVTKLWEFYELRSAWDGKVDARELVIPPHDPTTGSIAMQGDTGIVLVLLPGGTFTMGAQKENEDAASFDPQAETDEMPHELTLMPFFLARHELTQGQWARLWDGAENQRWPSYCKVGSDYAGAPGKIGLSHPVDSLGWAVCNKLLRRHGLLLPTEAQWEFGSRAGTTTPWYPGEVPASLVGHANVRDQLAMKYRPAWGLGEAFEDGSAGPTPVGHYSGANAFGLHDVHGNVCEWCRDGYGSNTARRLGDGLPLEEPASDYRIIRGGSYMDRATMARSANRSSNLVSISRFDIGVRPARSLTP